MHPGRFADRSGEREERPERRERLRTPKARRNLAQGGGFAEPWVPSIKARSSEGAKESVRTQVIKTPSPREDDDNLTWLHGLLRSYRAVRVLT
jgi:hypothetical protein